MRLEDVGSIYVPQDRKQWTR